MCNQVFFKHTLWQDFQTQGTKNYAVKTPQVGGGGEEFFIFTKLNFAAPAESETHKTAECKLSTCTHGNISCSSLWALLPALRRGNFQPLLKSYVFTAPSALPFSILGAAPFPTSCRGNPHWPAQGCVAGSILPFTKAADHTHSLLCFLFPVSFVKVQFLEFWVSY